jgi:hypothetical protein
MSKWIFSTLIVLLSISCNSNGDGGVKIFYGEKFEVATPITSDELIHAIDNDSLTQEIQVSGTIEKSCSHSGCWVTLENEQNKKIFVSYKDDGFTTAKKIEGKKVTLVGTGSHNEEKDQYEFVASGVILN